MPRFWGKFDHMVRVHPVPLLAIGLIASFGTEFAAVALGAPDDADAAVLVIAPPWKGGPEAIVAEAGGWVVAPVNAPLSVMATGASLDAFKAAGAWFLLDPGAFRFFCVSG
ncbi:hypothetical protein [Thalassovita mangrovi]|uniref:Uncharacterized protein n=1 Tax=Thalassovita mangrovi TaxID=2692236 RepID=A0A6L8LNL4_9RHOB|nr:hypothetical protein [Thalassovita mangrovi]MYM56170.1 hypothetical protein [Thalassovita mangrovi]